MTLRAEGNATIKPRRGARMTDSADTGMTVGECGKCGLPIGKLEGKYGAWRHGHEGRHE